MILEWHDEAKEEFSEAAVYYEGKVEDLGERFIVQVEAVAARILAAPLLPRCLTWSAESSALSASRTR